MLWLMEHNASVQHQFLGPCPHTTRLSSVNCVSITFHCLIVTFIKSVSISLLYKSKVFTSIYVLQRPLQIYSNRCSLAMKPGVQTTIHNHLYMYSFTKVKTKQLDIQSQGAKGSMASNICDLTPKSVS